MNLENIVENICYCFTVENTGMKVFQIVGTEVDLPFCEQTDGAAMELVCFRNRAGGPAVIRISGTYLKYGVPEDGEFYFVSCRGAFVQTFPMLECYNHEVILRTGTHWCQMTEEFTRSSRDSGLYICDGNLALTTDGAVLGRRLREITQAALELSETEPMKIFGWPDNMKFRSCMTLFAQVSEDDLFAKVLDKFFGGEEDYVQSCK